MKMRRKLGTLDLQIRSMTKRKSKTESRVQALKDAIASKSGTDEEHSPTGD
jgi:chaperonin cofactor prefoldin